MAKNYECSVELRELEKLINNFTYRNGFEIRRVFDDFLTFIIHGCSPGAPPLETWKYKKEHNEVFYEMYCQWVHIMNEQLKKHEWYDAFGDLYMALVVSKSNNLKQIFTPPHLCDLMARVVLAAAPEEGIIQGMDPTCGSGRNLLATHALNPTAYQMAEDIDKTCCMMTVCNFLIHGVHGEVIWHDSLRPDTYWQGWRTNDLIWLTKYPYIEDLPKEQSRIWVYWEKRRLEILAKKEQEEQELQQAEQTAAATTETAPLNIEAGKDKAGQKSRKKKTA